MIFNSEKNKKRYFNYCFWITNKYIIYIL